MQLCQAQLAVLATYLGDEFLALYHCTRSLAVKEPFPDAWNNLILLFEKVRFLLSRVSGLNFHFVLLISSCSFIIFILISGSFSLMITE